jgi:hypothetical protein
MFCNVSSYKSRSIIFAESERMCKVLCNVTLGKCIREKGFVVVN